MYQPNSMAVVQLRSILLLLLLLILAKESFGSSCKVQEEEEEEEEEEEFKEGLLLRPLPDRKVLAHFHFESRAPPSFSNGLHHHLFPKSISQLVQKFHVKELELSFTQGRWNYERWGGFDPISSSNVKPPGVELWAVFDVPEDQVDASWKNLTHTLSGLFCASINFLESSTMYSAPKWSFGPASGGSLRYGVLPREAICTENLTPWLKLLPCRDKAGLPALMDRPAIYRGFYHSQRLHITTYKNSLESISSGVVLEQTLTVVLQPSHRSDILTHSGEMNFQPSWSLSSIFGRKVSGGCALAKSSHVYIQLEKALMAELNKNKNHETDSVASVGFSGEPGFDLSVKPDRVFKEDDWDGHGSSVLYDFSVQKSSDHQPFDLGFTWKIPLIWSCMQAPLHASRFLMGSGNERGAIAILLKSKEVFDYSLQTNTVNGICKLQVDVFQVVPWYIKVYYHTLRLFIDGQPKEFEDMVEKIHVLPSKDKVSPGVMEMVLKLPCSVKLAALTLEFDKGFFTY